MRILPSVALAAAILGIPGASSAQEEPITFLGRLILAAGLSPSPEAALPRAVTVITGDEIRERGIDQAVEAIRSQPGVAVNRSGGPGSLTQLRLRGTEGRHVQVILDGVRLDPAQNGEFDFAGLQTADIERIEIIRGPQSVFFGSNTIGGVVSITTRQATEPGLSGGLGIEAGSDGTTAQNFQLGLRGERGGLTFSGVARNEGGWDIADVFGTGGGTRDGMRNRTLNLAGDWQLSDDWRIGFLLRGRNQRNDSDAFNFGAADIEGIVTDADNVANLQERIGSVFAEGDLIDGRLRLTLRASRFRLDTQRFGSGVQNGDDRADRTEIALRGVYALDGATAEMARHTLGFGLDRISESYTDFDRGLTFGPRRTTGLALEYRGNLAEGLDVQAGIRHDLNDRFSNTTTWSLGVSYAFAESGTRLRASAGTAVQNPTLFGQFGFSNNFVPNPDLRPERSRGWDLGIDQDLFGGRAQLSFTLFDNRITDLISSTASAAGFTPINLDGTSRRQGAELGLDAALTDRLGLRLAYTYTDARSPEGARLVRRPRHEATLGLDWQATDMTRVSLDMRRVQDNLDTRFFPDFSSQAVRLPDYTLFNLSATHRLNDRVSLHARINNLTDRRHQEVLGYAAQPRTVFVGLRASF